ncbi:MAG: tetraacyldisaccharide 4'-kinase [Rhodoferax sp.]|jgi:tetraacyldisaccharide 4'-kinase|nr:tetraacyldisaccharide 4'-kinase [Rhodoferax sp.]
MQQRLVDSWNHRGTLTWLLRPVSWLYGALVALRKGLYRRGVLRPQRVNVPVIVVGNVVAGGAGKTPAVLAIVRHLLQQGRQVGIVSRGHGRRDAGCRQVLPGSAPEDVGDEPLMLHRATGVPVFVARQRIDAARALLLLHPAVDVLVCDDGLQHLQLHRDIEICVFDRRGAGNGCLLPAGPLREPWPRPVDLILADASLALPQSWGMRRSLSGWARRADDHRIPLEALAATPVWAVAGIARPQPFFDMLRDAGLRLSGTTALPDHASFAGLEPPVRNAEVLVCTEKDAVKLWAIRPDAWAVPLELDIAPGFWERLDTLLQARGGARLSSRHGYTTA